MALTFTLTGPNLTIPFDLTPDEYGVRWHASCTGWDGPPVSANLTPRPGDHGAFRGPSYYGSRPLTLEGICTAPNLTELRRAYDRLDLLVPIGADIDVTSTENRTAVAQRSGPLLRKRTSEQTMTFSIALEAADPWKYGQQQQVTVPISTDTLGTGYLLLFPLHLYTAGGMTVRNDGTQQVRPVVTYWGPCSGPYSANTATGVTDGYDITLATTDDFLVVDHDLGSALLGGTSPRRNLRIPTYRPWHLEPQSDSTISAGAVSASPGSHVDVTFYPTFL